MSIYMWQWQGRRQEGEDKDGEENYYKKKGGEAHMGQEWDSDESSIDSSGEDATNITINKGLLFPNVVHKCLMAKDDKKKKVHSRDTPKYTTSDDEGSSSDNEDDLTSLFANLTKDQKKKINQLIESINKKDDLLKCQEDLLVKENKKFVKLKKGLCSRSRKMWKLI
jgi:transcription initiation factor IIF auxiliary subunit